MVGESVLIYLLDNPSVAVFAAVFLSAVTIINHFDYNQHYPETYDPLV